MKISAKQQEQDSFCPAQKNSIYLSPTLKQLMRLSLLSFILILATLQLLLASTVKGQEMSVEKVTVSLEHEPLARALKQIEQQTSLRFFYRKSEIAALNKLTILPASRTVEQTLYTLLQSSAFSFRQIDQTILIHSTSQTGQTKRKINGVVLSAETKLPVQYAMIQLISKNGLQLTGQSATDSLGRFELTTTDQNEQSLRITLMGYHLYSVPVTTGGDINLPAIYLVPNPTELREVIIAARSPLIKQEVDRLSYNVQADPENKLNSLLDMLRKVPLLSVDADDNVKFKGSSSFKVLIDGRTSSLVVNNPKDIFRSMSASNIQRIEVITIPPAKYDGEGLAGILNIVTVKKTIDGYSGNIGTSYKFPNGPRTYGSFNFKQGKFAITSYGGWNEYNTPQSNFSLLRKSIPAASIIDQQGTANTKSNQGYASTQLTYELDSLNLISAIVNYTGGSSNRLGSIFTQQTDSLYHQYKLDNDGHSDQNSLELGLDYQLGFKRSKGQLLSFSYRFNNSSSEQNNLLSASQQTNEDLSDYSQNNTSGTHEHTAQADYTQTLGRLNMEAGVKGIFRNNFSDFALNGTNLENSPLLTSTDDSFDYKQNVYSAYNSYELNSHNWTVKAGLRLEYTNIQAQLSGIGKLRVPNYTNLLPSFAIQRKLSTSASINFGYAQRILRPGIQQLNPYTDRQNPDFISYGNPDLRPEVNHIISLTYSLYKKAGITAGLSYAFSNNAIQYISTLGTDGVTRGTYGNLGTNNNLEADLNISCPLSQQLTVNFNAQVSYLISKRIIDVETLTRKTFIGNSSLNISYNLGSNWRSGYNFLYFSPAKTLQATSSAYVYNSLSLSKSVLNKKLTISGSASNPFSRLMDYKYNYVDPHFTQITHNDIVYRRFNVGLNYQFGKFKKEAIKKNKKTVENTDIKVVPSIIPNN
jgi:outer membrane receptor protein involved in Fe transport